MEHDEAIEKMRGAVLAAGRAALPSLVKALLELGAGGLDLLGGTGTQRLQKWVEEEIWDAVLRRLPDVEARVAELQRAGVPINVSDFVRVVEQYARAWRDAADAKKRKLLEDAFVRSFDRELYESGLLNVLWGHLDRLSYGDLVLFRELCEYDRNQPVPEAVIGKHGLATRNSLGKFHARNLLREGVVWCPEREPERSGDFRPTELGMKLRALAWDQVQQGGDGDAGTPRSASRDDGS